MSSKSDDSQNRSNVWTNPSIQGESPLSSSSSEVVGKVNQASPLSCTSTPSASGREVSPTVPLKKVGGRKRTDAGVPEMRGSLDKRDALVARTLDEELRRSATEAAPGPEERADDPPKGFVAIYESAMQQGLRLSVHPFFREVLKDWNLAPCQIIPNSWGQMVASYLLWVVAEAEGNLTPREFESIYRSCRSLGWYNVSPRLDCGKPQILKRNQGELRLKCKKVRALSNEFRSLNNLLKDDNLLASCGLLAFRFKGVPMIHLARPASGEGSSLQASRQEASGPSQEAQDAVPSSTIPPPRPKVDANVPPRLPSFSNLHIDSTTLRDKGKKVVEGAEEVPSQKRKAPAAMEGLMRDARKARKTEKGCRYSPSLDGEPEGAKNSASSAGQNRRIRISECREELPVLLAEVNLVRGLVLAKEIFSAFASFDTEDSKSKKLAKDLKVMGLEKAKLESDKSALQFKLDLVLSKETDMKAKYEIELNAAKECLKQVRDQMRAAEASQKRAEEAQNSLEVAVANNERSLTATKLELEKIKAERAVAEARAMEAYQDAFVDTSEYQDLAQRLMTVGGKQLVERIIEAHPEWDLSFLREAPIEVHVSEADLSDIRGGDEGPSCADP
ncbi:Uncharacterized protein Adt_20730 [Abeliophyllum distichum]|uniref:Transposase (putative) gypsy type domain-containing protein n=1 Tax=Abeliophyllum distichum TaxID=126358 RepID=A0ABD1SXF9_9LAMI